MKFLSLEMRMCVVCTAAFVLQLCLTGYAVAESPETPKAKLTSPAEIVTIMENSALSYELRAPGPSSSEGDDSKGVLSPGLILKRKGDKTTLDRYALSPPADSRLAVGEKVFRDGNFEGAIKIYEEVRRLEPDYHQALILIGDAYFSMRQFDEAQRYFEEAIRLNFIDYQAHWFLADTLWSLGRREHAMVEITIAHLLNVNHKTVRKSLVGYRQRLGRPWKDWTYAPRVGLSREGNRVLIHCSEEWIGYCLVKAVWRYEPGYAESKGPAGEVEYNSLEEREALAAVLAHNDTLGHIRSIVEDGSVEEFLWYEVVAKRSPAALLLLPRDTFMSIVTYVDRYH
ncbi:MAG: tetratricopeptide repeat protein [Rhodospirillales bacterium]|nr:tetratricopeptide repeat protein [Rhodospirillales bacterium]MDH3911068.1 tetratricopeptide repeat protein [Rhodospirillales bacterium]MDH3916940.1 tetratricopeptide repeat protein [Rhodospirillales bacterium]